MEKLHTTGSPVDVDAMQYRLIIDGLVEHPLSLSIEDIERHPLVTETVLLICPYFFVDNAEWTGVTVAELLREAKIKAGADKVTFSALDGYADQLDLSDVMREGVFLAYRVNGQVLLREHGYPVRLIVKNTLSSP